MDRVSFLSALVALVMACPAAARAAGDDQTFQIAPLVAHLEFLGYKVEQSGTGLTAKHPVKINFSAKPLGSGLLMTAFFSGKEKTVSPEKLTLTNDLNRDATLARFYWDQDGDLAIEAWIVGTYDKARFSLVMDAWDADTGLLSKHREDVLKLLK